MSIFSALADGVVVVHLAYVSFVIFGLFAILLGGLCKWHWVRNRWFRSVHLTMIGIVVVEALLGIECPLTTLEFQLRSAAGQSVQEGSFVGRLANELLFYDFSPEFFTILYCTFGAIVLATLFFVPVRWRGSDLIGRTAK